jgi:Putative zinc- or iron-chelating domain
MATEPIDRVDEVRAETARGLEYAHDRANTNTGKLLEIASFAYSTIELLAEKGIISIEEVDERKQVVAERLAEKFRRAGMGVVRSEPELDKYSFSGSTEIDCENRVHLCKAACCRLDFALSKQDVEEGVVQWEFSRPYMIKRAADGYCTHLDKENGCTCRVYEHRPVPCRGYDCRDDKRIWADFEKRIPSPDLVKLFPEEADA